MTIVGSSSSERRRRPPRLRTGFPQEGGRRRVKHKQQKGPRAASSSSASLTSKSSSNRRSLSMPPSLSFLLLLLAAVLFLPPVQASPETSAEVMPTSLSQSKGEDDYAGAAAPDRANERPASAPQEGHDALVAALDNNANVNRRTLGLRRDGMHLFKPRTSSDDDASDGGDSTYVFKVSRGKSKKCKPEGEQRRCERCRSEAETYYRAGTACTGKTDCKGWFAECTKKRLRKRCSVDAWRACSSPFTFRSFDTCADVTDETYWYEDFKADLVIPCDDDELDKSDDLNSAFLSYFNEVEQYEFATDECGPREVVSSAIHRTFKAGACYDEEVEVTDRHGRRVQIVGRRLRSMKVKGRKRSRGKCRNKCRGRSGVKKVDDSINPEQRRERERRRMLREAPLADSTGQRRLQESNSGLGKQGVVEYPENPPNLTRSLGEVNITVEDANVFSVSEVPCNTTVDECTDGSDLCCGTEGCTCGPQHGTESNCLVGTSLTDGGTDSCFLLATTEGGNRCCKPDRDASERAWLLGETCIDTCGEVPDDECGHSLAAEGTYEAQNDTVFFTLTVFNECNIDVTMKRLKVDICVECSFDGNPESKTGTCTGEENLLGDLKEQTGSAVVETESEKQVFVLPNVANIEEGQVCVYVAQFRGTSSVPGWGIRYEDTGVSAEISNLQK